MNSRMSSQPEEETAAASCMLSHTSDKLNSSSRSGASGKTAPEKGNGSPAQSLLGGHSHHRDMAVQSDQPEGVAGDPVAGPPKKKKMAAGAPPTGPLGNSNSERVRSTRLMIELKNIQSNEQNDPAFTVELIGDNLYEWHVRLYRIDSESELATDMRELGISCISLHLTFPEHYPYKPPFMHVVSPHIEKGFVMAGGAICMELLTSRGWAAAYTVEALITQFAASVVKGQGRIARQPKRSSPDFSRELAEESFRSLVNNHDKYGWVTPSLADG